MERIRKGWAVFKMSYKIAKELKTVWSLILTSLGVELFVVSILSLISLKIYGWDFKPESFYGVMENLGQNQVLATSILIGFVSVFIATFFNFAITYNVLEFLRNKRKVNFSESISFAFGRLADITIWSLVIVTVNIIFQILDNIAERLGSIGELIMRIINGLLGAAWNLLTLFVVPIYVENKESSVISVLKRSKNIFVSTWGETVVATASLGIFSFLFVFGIIIIAIVLTTSSAATNLIWVVMPLAAIMVIFVLVFNSAMDRIYKILLYIYAETKEVPEVVENRDVIENAFKPKKS